MTIISRSKYWTSPSSSSTFLFFRRIQYFVSHRHAFVSWTCPSSPSFRSDNASGSNPTIVRHHTTTTGTTNTFASRDGTTADRHNNNDRRGIITGTVPRNGTGIEAGQIAQSRRTFTQSDVDTFARLSGDLNPLHQSTATTSLRSEDEDMIKIHQSKLKFDDSRHHHSPALVHGILVASLFSHIFGNLIPGCVYYKQTLHFRQPVYVDDVVVGRIEVVEVRKLRGGRHVVHCDTTVLKETTTTTTIEDEIVCVQGTAEVLLPPHPSLPPT